MTRPIWNPPASEVDTVLFLETKLAGAYIIEWEPEYDARGFFARTWCSHEFAQRGLCQRWSQSSVSYNAKRGTLRGLHYQVPPYEETKLVRCTRGHIYDVIVDLRPQSPTFREWVAVELSSANGRMVYLPEGTAHGYQTLADCSEVFYQISVPYTPEAVRGLRWDDPAFRIEWPLSQPVLSERDSTSPHYRLRHRPSPKVSVASRKPAPPVRASTLRRGPAS